MPARSHSLLVELLTSLSGGRGKWPKRVWCRHISTSNACCFGAVQDEFVHEPWLSITKPEERQGLVRELHALKTELFMDIVETGAMPLRPGVKRLVTEALDAGRG